MTALFPRLAALLAPLALGAGAQSAPPAADSGALFHVRINFQPAKALLPGGYLADAHKLADVGRPYGPQGAGGQSYTYGWTRDNAAGMRALPSSSGGDQERDTLALTQLGGDNGWQIAVPNGLYRVQFLSDGPGAASSVYDTSLEGQDTGAVKAGGPAIIRSATVRVSDGKLTVKNGPAARNNALNWIDIQQLLSVKINFQPSGAPTPKGYQADTGEVFGERGGLKYGWKSDNTRSTRLRDTPADARYNTLALLGTNSWQIELPTGQYDVRVVAGDPGEAGGISKLSVTSEGGTRLIVSGEPAGQSRWTEGAARTLQVGGFLGSPNLLTLSGAPGAANNAIDFVEIQQTGQGR